ncbi:hypothetical protein MNB_SV-14-1006 [hydrothermal vent metagenome]|uniref:Nitrous oxide reductase maturation protein, outer-membrane lipoprotein NosL n=1 Tax=hydrothermal vent metagenome TaxID=652676 RepID=A0A1W1CHZ2_9ZZZZ
MKKLLPLLIIFVILGVLAVIFVSMAKDNQPITIAKGNIEKKPLEFKLNFTNDSHCKMLIRKKENSLQAVNPNGETWFFDDPACMVEWLENQSFKKEAKLWVYTIDTKKWIDAKKAWYGVTDKTAMHSGFGARENKTENSIGFTEMSLRTLRGETLANPKIRKKLLGY